MGSYNIEQYVRDTNRFELVPEGEFDTKEAAIAAMNDLVIVCGFSRLRVVDESCDEAIAFSEVDIVSGSKFLRAVATSPNFVTCVYLIGGVEVEVEWSNIDENSGDALRFFYPTEKIKTEDTSILARLYDAIYKGETDDNIDLDLYLFIRDTFNNKDCEFLVEETFN